MREVLAALCDPVPMMAGIVSSYHVVAPIRVTWTAAATAASLLVMRTFLAASVTATKPAAEGSKIWCAPPLLILYLSELSSISRRLGVLPAPPTVIEEQAVPFTESTAPRPEATSRRIL